MELQGVTLPSTRTKLTPLWQLPPVTGGESPANGRVRRSKGVRAARNAGLMRPAQGRQAFVRAVPSLPDLLEVLEGPAAVLEQVEDGCPDQFHP